MISLDVAKRLAQALRPAKPDVAETSGGVVTRVDNDGTVWVQLHGAEDDTPCTSQTAAVRVGDAVTVTIDGGSARVDGNVTRPATDDERADEAHELATQAVDEVAEVRETATVTARLTAIANGIAEEAQAVASAINQHFFSDTNGVHVTEAEGDPTTEHNILINSLGILLRHATNPLVSITQSAIAFYDGLGSAASNIVASFGASIAQIGKASANHVVIDSNGMEVLDGSTSRAFFGSTARIGATAAPHVNVNSTGMQVYADASTKTAEVASQGDVSYLRLVDSNRYVSASTGGSGSSTKDNITVGSYGVNNSHRAGVNLIAVGTSGQAELRVHDEDSEGASLDVTPSKVVVSQGVDLYARKDVYVGGSLSIVSPLATSSGGTGSDSFGTIETTDVSTAVSVPNSSWKSLGSVTLAEGSWIVSYNAYFASNSTGRRGMLIHTTADATSAANLRQGGVEVMAVDGGVTMLNGCRVLNLTASSTTYHLNVLQTSGAALNVTGYIRAFQLK